MAIKLPRLPGMRAPKARSPEVLARAKTLAPRIRTRARIRKVGRAVGGAAALTADWLLQWLSGGSLDLGARTPGGGLGLFGQALGKGAGAGVDTGALPTLEKPERVSNINNPTIATISKQLDVLVKTANKIGLQTKQQQDALLSQMAQARRVAKEQQLEQKAPVVPELPAGVEAGQQADSLAPLDESADNLAKKIDDLADSLEKSNNQSSSILSNLASGLGLASMMGARSVARAPIPRSKLGGRTAVKIAGETLVKTGNAWQVVTQTAAGGLKYRFASKELTAQAEKKSTGILARAANAARLTAGKIGAPTLAAGAMSSKIANIISGGLKNAGRKGTNAGAIKAAVRKAAGPIISRSLGRTALKSIPIIGAGIGAAFAIGRLLKGDILGAGLDLTSGIAGPMTAIPALAATVSRDTYASVYGVQPEQDPEFGSRMSVVNEAVMEMIKEQLGPAVQVKKPPSEQERGDIETPKTTPQRVSAQPPAPPASPTTPTTPTTGSSGAPASGTSSAARSGSGAGTSGAAAAAQTPNAQTGTQLTAAETSMASAGQMTGEYLNAQAIPTDNYWNQFGYMPDVGRFLPQATNTSRGAAQGYGNIPDPVYRADNLEELKTTLFFGY